MTLINNLPVWRLSPIRKLTIPTIKISGRNNKGRITSFHRGGGVKRRFRIVDFQRRLSGIPALVLRIEKDPFRTAPLALIVYSNGILSYIPAVNGLRTKNLIMSGPNALIAPGNTLPMTNIPLATIVHNIANNPSSPATFVRVGGSKAHILRKIPNTKFTVLKLPSGELRMFHSSSRATVGSIMNDLRPTFLKKAGNSRWKGRRPIVRGVAMNPIDHPHGGGEGKTSGGRHSCSPWGILTKGFKTRSPKKLLTNVISTRFQQRAIKGD